MAKRPRKAAAKRTKKAATVRKRPVAKKRSAKRAPKRSAKRPATKRPVKRLAKRVKLPPVQTLRTPPSSLDMDRSATSARSGRQAMAENQRRHPKMAAVTGGDVDVDVENAYFTGDETPGGDNMTPDQSDVDEIGHAVGVEYGDTEELKGSDKVAERDKHRWETE
jgi:Family of unknown function (DUF6335)